MLLLLPLFQGICGNKIKKTQSSQCYYYYLCSMVLVKKEKKKVTNVTNITIFLAVLRNKSKENPKFPMLLLLPIFQGVCLRRQKWKLPMLLLLLLFQAVCGNKIKKKQSS